MRAPIIRANGLHLSSDKPPPRPHPVSPAPTLHTHTQVEDKTDLEYAPGQQDEHQDGSTKEPPKKEQKQKQEQGQEEVSVSLDDIQTGFRTAVGGAVRPQHCCPAL